VQIERVALPYALDALEPQIDNATMNFHVSIAAAAAMNPLPAVCHLSVAQQLMQSAVAAAVAAAEYKIWSCVNLEGLEHFVEACCSEHVVVD
jgi:hypothetical protein